MKTLPTACTILLLAGSALAERSIEPKGSIEFRTDVIGCINFDDAIEAARLRREAKDSEVAKFVERQHALGDPHRDCKSIEDDGRDWPLSDVIFVSPKLTSGTLAICTSPPASKLPDGSCGFWVVVHLRDVLRK